MTSYLGEPSYRDMLEPETDFKVIAIANDGREAVEKASHSQPELILMDISLRQLNGFDAARHIRASSPTSKIVFLAERDGSDFIDAAFQAGALGYILKSDAHSDLLAGIRAVLRGQRFVSRSLKDGLDTTDS